MTELPPEIDTSRAHSARIYDYLLGGKNHFAADRELADAMMRSWPVIRVGVRAQRGFLIRAVRYLTGEAGVRQFLDIGAGLPTTNNVHEVAQLVEPSARVVYVDNDPLVLTHARALLTSSAEGRIAYVQADIRDPAELLGAPEVREVLDFGQPIALMLVGILHFLPEEDRPREILKTLLDALPSGSYLVASHFTGEHDQERADASGAEFFDRGLRGALRDSSAFADLAFSGLQLVPPGVVLASEWRPDEAAPRPAPFEVNVYAGVARKP
jgi:hypothetical protein